MVNIPNDTTIINDGVYWNDTIHWINIIGEFILYLKINENNFNKLPYLQRGIISLI